MEWNTVQPPVKTPQVGETIVFAVLAKSGAAFAVAIGILCAGFGVPYAPIQLFMIGTGAILSAILFLALVSEWDKQDRLFELHVTQNMPEVSKVPEKMEISVTHKTETGSQTKIYTFDKDKLPPADFVNFIFDTAGTDGRVLTERAIGEFKQWQGTGYNDWLSVMDKLEITRKVDERPNSARRLACTREVALQHFNYEIKEHGK